MPAASWRSAGSRRRPAKERTADLEETTRRRAPAARAGGGTRAPPPCVHSYSYLHLAMVAGIVLFALGLKTTLGHVGEPLDTVPAVALCAGTAVYLLGHIAFLYRTTGRIFRRRTVGAVVLLALTPRSSSDFAVYTARSPPLASHGRSLASGPCPLSG